MKTMIRARRVAANPMTMLTLTALLAFASLLVYAQTPNVPDSLKPSAGEQLALKLGAIGVQIYECKNQPDGKPPAWAFVAPEADLFDSAGKRVGKHYAGPHWELGDGSKVQGSVKQRADSSVPGAIPHLLLGAKSVGSAGQLASTASIQRLNTIGGVAPADGCSAADVGKQARVYYTADYYYYASK